MWQMSQPLPWRTRFTLVLLGLLAGALFLVAIVGTLHFWECVQAAFGRWVLCEANDQCSYAEVCARQMLQMSLTVTVTSVMLVVLADISIPGYLIVFGYVLSEPKERVSMMETLAAGARDRKNSFSTFLRNVSDCREHDKKVHSQ